MATGEGCEPGASGGVTDTLQEPSVPSSPPDSSQEPQKKSSPTSTSGIPDWRAAVKKSYPGLLTHCYFVPSIHINRTDYVEEDKYSQKSRPVWTPMLPSAKGPVQWSDMQNDWAQQSALYCFRYLAQSQVMFVLSEIQFGNYLKHGRELADLHKLPKIWDPEMKDKRRGDFDILVFHRQFGVLAMELKSVGYTFEDGSWSDEDKSKTVYDRIGRKAMKQMGKVKEVLCHLLSDLHPPCRVTLTLGLPYVSRSLLRTILDSNPDFKKDLCQRLDIPDTSDPSQYCLLSDDMPEKAQPWEMTDRVKQALGVWWGHVMSDRGEDENMTEDRYVDIVSRFCGPATEVTLRTLGEGVTHVGDQFTRLVLTPEQVDVLEADDARVLLCGPPGVGKTVVLIQKALDWLKRKLEVHVVSVSETAMAAAELIYGELAANELYDALQQNVQLHHVSKQGEGKVVGDLKSAAQKGNIAVVMDEAVNITICSAVHEYCLKSNMINGKEPCHAKKRFLQLQKMLQNLTDTTHIHRLWLVSGDDVSDELNLKFYPMKNPLRTPPAVTREVQKSAYLALNYSAGEAPLPSDGPPVLHLCHTPGQHGHSDSNPDCHQCGKDVAKVLTETLRIGQAIVGTGEGEKEKNIPGSGSPQLTNGNPGSGSLQLANGKPGSGSPQMTKSNPGTGSPLLTKDNPGSGSPQMTKSNPGTGSPLLTKDNPGSGSPPLTNGKPGSSHKKKSNPRSPQEKRGNPGSPQEKRGSPKPLQEKKGNPGSPQEKKGNRKSSQEKKGNPKPSQKKKGNPGSPHEKEDNPGSPHEKKGNPKPSQETKGNPGSESPHLTKDNPRPDCPQFKDVFILTMFKHIPLFLQQPDDKSVPRAPGFLDGLRQAGIPLKVVQSGDQKALADVVNPDRADEVVVTDVLMVRGLERKVVVWKQWKGEILADKDVGRLYGASRCTSQLAFVWYKEEEMVAVEDRQ